MELPGDIIAFLPVAELGERVLNDVFEIGKEYEFAIVSLDVKDHKMGLTLPGKKPAEETHEEPKEETPIP